MNLEVQLAALQVDKEDTAAAITEKGGTLSQNPGFDTFATDVRSIDVNKSFKELIYNTLTTVTEDMFDINQTFVPNYAFYQKTSITTVNLPSSITQIGSSTFSGCANLTNINLGNIRSIGYGGFMNCTSLITVNLTGITSSVGTSAFQGCTNLTTIDLSDSVTAIGATAFQNCTSLTSITILKTTPPSLSNANAFTNTNDCPIYVPASSVSAYQAATNWSTIASRITAISS